MSGIRPTPTLRGKAADEFLRRMKEKEHHKPTKGEKKEMDRLIKELDKMPSLMLTKKQKEELLEDSAFKKAPCEECKGKDILIATLELELEGLRKRAYDVVGTFRELEAYLEKTNIDD